MKLLSYFQASKSAGGEAAQCIDEIMTNNSLDQPKPPSESSSVPSSSENKPVSSKVPPRKDDAVCVNCLGIAHYSTAMRAKDKRPICFGIEYKAAKLISEKEMEHLESKPPIPANENIDLYFVGFTQYSLRMSRLGQAPIVRFGFGVQMENVSAVARDSSQPKKERAKKTPAVVKERNAETFMADMKLSASRYWENYKKVCGSLFRGLSKVASDPGAIATRMTKSIDKVLTNYQRYLAKTTKNIYKRICDDKDGGDQSK